MFTKHIILIASALAAHASASCIHGTSLHKRKEAGGKVEVATFGYTGLLGPLNWAALAPENTACSTGKNQSPINIDAAVQLATEAPVIDFPNVELAEFENLGSTLEVIVNGTTTFAGTEFALRQFHFHTPSEHRIAEEYFPLEMHMVHEAADGSGGIAVLAVTFQLSDDGTTTTELLTSVTENLAEIEVPGTITETGPLDFTVLVNHLQTTPLFQYTGSLTTPPCAEGLTFLVTSEPLPLSVATFNAMKKIIKFNSRFTQNASGETNLIEVAAIQLDGTDDVVDDVVEEIEDIEDDKEDDKEDDLDDIEEIDNVKTTSAAALPPVATPTPTPSPIAEQHCIFGACHPSRSG